MTEVTESKKAGRPRPERGKWLLWWKKRLLWWKIDEKELARQVSGYKNLPFFKTARGSALACILVMQTLTLIFILTRFAGMDSSGFIDMAVFLFLSIFVGLGHRWALITVMTLWTLERVITSITTPLHTIWWCIFWWCIFMRAFYMAFRVEQVRRKAPTVEVFE